MRGSALVPHPYYTVESGNFQSSDYLTMEKTKKYVLDIFAKTSRFTASPAGRTPDPAGGQAAAGRPSPPLRG
jgi:hypothetical protein